MRDACSYVHAGVRITPLHGLCNIHGYYRVMYEHDVGCARLYIWCEMCESVCESVHVL